MLLQMSLFVSKLRHSLARLADEPSCAPRRSVAVETPCAPPDLFRSLRHGLASLAVETSCAPRLPIVVRLRALLQIVARNLRHGWRAL